MPTTYQLISSTTVGSGGAANIEFTSLPTTYVDLLLKVSLRSTESDNASSLRVTFNGDTGNIAVREARAVGTTTASYDVAYAQAGYVGASQSQANSFGIAEIYIPNYRSSNRKSSSADVHLPSSTANQQYLVLSARNWSVTDAITTIRLAPSAGSWVQYSTAYLYGIANS